MCGLDTKKPQAKFRGKDRSDNTLGGVRHIIPQGQNDTPFTSVTLRCLCHFWWCILLQHLRVELFCEKESTLKHAGYQGIYINLKSGLMRKLSALDFC